jgi:maleylpyruvate isomerase
VRLYGYWRSSATWRVRIGLALKGIDVDVVPVNLKEGQQRGHEHRQRSPLGQVPVLEWSEGQQTRQLSQSLAILHWIEANHPSPPLLPQSTWARARAWQLAEAINSGTQPLQNMYTQARLNQLTEGKASEWSRGFIEEGLDALETMAAQEPGTFLVGDTPTIADCCLIPQLYNARRYGCDLEKWPRLRAAENAAMRLSAFTDTHPDKQPDAPRPE